MEPITSETCASLHRLVQLQQYDALNGLLGQANEPLLNSISSWLLAQASLYCIASAAVDMPRVQRSARMPSAPRGWPLLSSSVLFRGGEGI